MTRWATHRRQTDLDLLATSSDTAPTTLPEENTSDDRNKVYDAKRGTTGSSSSSS